MTRELFGTDGVRGLAGEYPLNAEGARRIGMAVGTKFASLGQTVIIGCDTRESSAGLVSSLTAGLNEVGVNVTAVGVITTPGLAYLTRDQDFVAGVMVTASHNPYQYSGIKVFDSRGDKLPDSAEAELNQLIEAGVPQRGTGSSTTNEQLLKSYEDFLVASADGLQLDGLQLAVDSANGSASSLAQRVFERLGASVTPLFDKPDGRNINAGCGATDTKTLQKAVVDGHLPAGLAFDGDADRLMLVDAQGRELNGDHIMYLLAVQTKAPGVVATVMSNLGFEQALQTKNIKLLRTAVGDRYVLEGLQKTGYPIGGEQSGHIIIYDLLKTGDALLGAVYALKAMQSSGKSFAEWRDAVPMLPQCIVNIPLEDRALLEQPSVQSYVKDKTAALGDWGRMLIRPSGTEPVVRVMVEAPDAETQAKQIAAELQTLLGVPVGSKS